MGKVIGNGIEPAVSDPQSDSTVKETVKEMGKIIGDGRKPAVSAPESKTTRKGIFTNGFRKAIFTNG